MGITIEEKPEKKKKKKGKGKKKKSVVEHDVSAEIEVADSHDTSMQSVYLGKLQQFLDDNPVEGAPANVGLSIGYTRNLGDYESVKFQVSLHVPSSIDAIDETFAVIRDWCDDRLTEVVETYDEAANDDS